MKVYRCLDCGFRFRVPTRVLRSDIWGVPVRPRLVRACPRCGSDAVIEEGVA